MVWMCRAIIIGILLLTVSLLVSCSCGQEGMIAGKEGGDSIRSGAIEYDEPDPTSQDLILDAFENEEITEEEMYLYSMQAAFAKDKLPSQYVGDPMEWEGVRDFSPLLNAVANKIDTFSPAVQAELRPYTLSPTKPDSYWYTEGAVSLAAPSLIPDWLSIVPAVSAATNKNPNGKDFYVQVPTQADSAKAQTVLTALEKAMAKYKASGFPDTTEWVFVELKNNPLDDGGQGVDGMAWMDSLEGETTKRCNIIIKMNQNDKGLKATAAHELFHCVQYHYPLRDFPLDAWLYESTAVWSEEFVYPTANTEHGYDGLLFHSLHYAMFDISNDRHYASYLWWFYLYQQAGKHHSPIQKALVDAKKPSTQKKALKARPNFAKEHKEYALWNYNKAPHKYYQDTNNKPSYTPKPPARESWYVDDEFAQPMQLNMKPGAIRYQHLEIDSKVDKLTITLEEANGRAFEDMGVQMVYKIGNDWRYWDVTYEDEVVFCRNRPSEKVTELMLIFNNGNLDDLYLGTFEINGAKSCPPAWGGFISMNWVDGGTENDLPTLSGDPVSGSWAEKGSITIRDELVYDKENDEFLIKKTSYSYSSSGSQVINYGRSCGLLFEHDSSSFMGGGSKTWEIDKDKLWKSKAPDRFKGTDEGVYELDLDPAIGFFVSQSEKIEESNPCPLWGIATPAPPAHSSQVWESTYNSEDDYVQVSNPDLRDFWVELSDDRKRLTGHGEAWFMSEGVKTVVHTTIDYSYG